LGRLAVPSHQQTTRPFADAVQIDAAQVKSKANADRRRLDHLGLALKQFAQQANQHVSMPGLGSGPTRRQTVELTYRFSDGWFHGVWFSSKNVRWKPSPTSCSAR